MAGCKVLGAGQCDSLQSPVSGSTSVRFFNSVFLQRLFDCLNLALDTLLHGCQNGLELFQASQDVG